MDAAVDQEWDFFVSYTLADRAWAEWIAWELEEAGHRVLVQAWDMTPGTNWTHRIDEGVQRSVRTIAVLSPDYLNSVYGKAEWLAAWQRDPLGEEGRLLPVRVRECDRPGLLAQIVSVDLFGLSEAGVRRRLRDMATTGRDKRRPDFPGGRVLPSAPRFPGALPEIWKAPPRNPNFTGRDDSLSRLRKGLLNSSTVAVHSLHGMGGVGKTQLAIEYAHRHATDYDLVWWIDAEESAVIDAQFAPLAAKLGIPVEEADPGAVVAAVLDALRAMPRWLLVFDNADQPAQIRPLLPGGSGHVLVTTRRGGFGAVSRVVDVDILDRPESVALLRLRRPAITDEQSDRLADVLGDLPLAIEQAAAYLETTGTPVDEYVGLLGSRIGDMIDRGTVVGREHTLASLWRLSYEQLRDRHPAAVQLLQLCAYLAPERIPLGLFTAGVDSLPEPLASAAADPLEFAETVGALVDYSLVRRTEQHLSLHRLVQAATRHQDPTGGPAGGFVPLAVALNLLRRYLPGGVYGTPEDWPAWRSELAHVLAAVGHHDDTHPVDAEAASWLLDRAALFLITQGQPGAALPLVARALTIDETAHDPNHPTVSVRLNNLGLVLQDLGRPTDAQPLLERALTINETTHGANHPNVAIRLHNLAGVLQDLGRPTDAQPLLERALTISETAHGPNHPTIAITLYNLAGVLRVLGRPTDAQPLLERALTIEETAYGPDHPTIAITLNNLAGVLEDLGRDAEAEPLRERAEAIRRRNSPSQ